MTFVGPLVVAAFAVVVAVVVDNRSREAMDFGNSLEARPRFADLGYCKFAEDSAVEPFAGWVVAAE